LGVSTIALAVMLASAGPTALNDGEAAASPGAVSSEQPLPVPAVPPPAEPLPTPVEAAPPPKAAPAHPAAAPVSEEGVIVVNADPREVRADPLSDVNVATYDAVTAVDEAVLSPAAETYEKVMPEPIRNGIRNVLLNLVEPIVFVNYLLQFKPGKAMETLGRFGINSTLGVAGLFDMAKRKPFHLPYRQNGFSNTLAYHGVSTGAYLFLPVVGPTTVRDMVGRVLDVSLVPTVLGSPFNTTTYAVGTGVAKGLTDRVAFDEQIRANRAAADPYLATRDFYLKRRQAEVDALHSPEYRARKGIPDPVAPTAAPHVNDNAAPGSAAAWPTTYVPSSTGMAPAAPAEPVPEP
jgi:phospholipid-binding lipoprotein MlaA